MSSRQGSYDIRSDVWSFGITLVSEKLSNTVNKLKVISNLYCSVSGFVHFVGTCTSNSGYSADNIFESTINELKCQFGIPLRFFNSLLMFCN